MKKLFISCPMRGRTETNIRKSREKMHRIAEAAFGEELEVIQNYIEDRPPKDSRQAVWCLGKSIELLSKADYFIGIDWCYGWKGCDIEKEVARVYGIPGFEVRINRIISNEEMGRMEEARNFLSDKNARENNEEEYSN